MNSDPRINFPRYEWPKGKRSAVVFSLDLDAESPLMWRSRGKDNLMMGELEQRRFGPRQGIARVVELLREQGIRGTFYVPGTVAESHPELLPWLCEAGHEIGYHGYFHERIEEIAVGEAEDYLCRAQELFRTQTGLSGLGHRAPSWEMTPEFLKVLGRNGVAYDSSLMGFDHPYSHDGLVQVPVQWLVDDALYFRYTNSPRDKTHPANPAAVLESWIEEFEGTREVGGLFMITVHEWISGRGQRIRMLRRLFQHIASYNDVWWARADEVAAWHRSSSNLARFDVQARILLSHF